MGRTGGKETKAKILKTAEKLFSQYGIDAVTVDKIAEKAGVNKALIYYHFKNKDDVINTLFTNFINSLLDNMEETFDEMHKPDQSALPGGMRKIISFLSSHRHITGMVITEALRTGKYSDLFFEVVRILITNEQKGVQKLVEKHHPEANSEYKKMLVFEFFTGFMPLLSFVLFKDKFSSFFELDKDELTALFIESFCSTHTANHKLEGYESTTKEKP